MLADTNPAGDLFGDWLRSGGLGCLKHGRMARSGRCVTVAVNKSIYFQPENAGDEIYDELIEMVRTSIALRNVGIAPS